MQLVRGRKTHTVLLENGRKRFASIVPDPHAAADQMSSCWARHQAARIGAMALGSVLLRAFRSWTAVVFACLGKFLAFLVDRGSVRKHGSVLEY